MTVTWPQLSLAALCLGFTSLMAQPAAIEVPDGGRDMLPLHGKRGAFPVVPADKGVAIVERITAGDAPWTTYWRFKIQKPPVNAWDVQLGGSVEGGIKQGDTCLLVFYARTVEGGDEKGKAFGGANVEVKNPPKYPKLGSSGFRIGRDWEAVTVPFVATEDGPEGKCGVAIHLGTAVQTIDIGGLRLLNYGQGFPVAKLPRPLITYEGREADAPWRKDAMARIEKHRKGGLSIEVTDEAGNAIPDVEVHAVLKRHEFGFGSAVTAKWMNDPSPEGEKYRAIVDQCFSRVVFENDLKPSPWQVGKDPDTKGSFRAEWLDKSLAWFAERQISVRGHYLCWGPFEPWSLELKDKPEAIRDRVFAYMKEVVPAVGDRVAEWDALNHPAGWEVDGCIDTVLGDGFYTDVFREARKLTKLPLWINEDQVFRPGRQQEEFYENIKRLIADGQTPDGIGNQAHFHSSLLPSPMEMLANSDRFAELVPALQLTEFDVNTNGDEQLAADFTRDVLITTFSHPAYTGFVMWGFWEGSHWKPETALWRQDWSEKPAAKVWKQLVNGQWKTDVTVKTDASGGASVRGFHGLYELTLTKDGRTLKAKARISKGVVPVVIKLVLP